MTIKKKNENTKFKNTFFLIGLNLALLLTLIVFNWETEIVRNANILEPNGVDSLFGPPVFPIPEMPQTHNQPEASETINNELFPPEIIMGDEDSKMGNNRRESSFIPLLISYGNDLSEIITITKFSPPKDSIYDEVEPSFLYGKPDEYLKEKIWIPQNAIILRISGVVNIEFIVEANGEVKYVKIIAPQNRQLGYGIEEACMQAVLSTSKMWEPAEKDGIKVRSRVRAPIEIDNNSF